MRIDEHIAYLREEGKRLVALLEVADLSVLTPSCPEWTVGELARHTGRVHRWAATYVLTGQSTPLTAAQHQAAYGPMPDDASVPGWVRAGLDRLVTALSEAPADLRCYRFLPSPSPLAFWARRQAHETAVHRVDIQLAHDGTVGPEIPVDLATDGVDELLLGFFGKPRKRMRSDQPRTLAFAATDTPATWLIHIGPEGGRTERAADPAAPAERVTGWVRAPANVIYLGLWNRCELDVAGDAEPLRRWRRHATVNW